MLLLLRSQLKRHSEQVTKVAVRICGWLSQSCARVE
jgi:hypothetical protein